MMITDKCLPSPCRDGTIPILTIRFSIWTPRFTINLIPSFKCKLTCKLLLKNLITARFVTLRQPVFLLCQHDCQYYTVAISYCSESSIHTMTGPHSFTSDNATQNYRKINDGKNCVNYYFVLLKKIKLIDPDINYKFLTEVIYPYSTRNEAIGNQALVCSEGFKENFHSLN